MGTHLLTICLKGFSVTATILAKMLRLEVCLLMGLAAAVALSVNAEKTDVEESPLVALFARGIMAFEEANIQKRGCVYSFGCSKPGVTCCTSRLCLKDKNKCIG